MLAAAAEPAITPANLVSFALGGLALILSIASLTWQFVQWRRSGAILRVEAAPAVGVGGQPPFDELLAITVRNSGRGAASVTGWGIRFDDGSHIPGHAQNIAFNPPVPVQLAGGAAQTFYLTLRPTVEAIAEHGVPQTGANLGCRAFMALGTGAEVTSKDLGHVRVLHDAVHKLITRRRAA
jgi:hypothetical protein